MVNNQLRDRDEVLNDLKRLIRTPGYIYPLLLIIFEDFHIDPESLHNMDNYSRLNMNEASLLLGFLIQESIDFSLPESFDQVFEMKKKTYDLMRELHQAFHKPFFEKLLPMVEGEVKKSSRKDFFGQGDLLVEPIFYAGTGVYDFQYLEFLEKKYKFDSDWLKRNKGFVCSEVVELFKKIKEILQKKCEKVHLYVHRNLKEMEDEARKTYKGSDFESDFEKIVNMAELHQYVDLFADDSIVGLDPQSEEFGVASQKAFYKNLIDLFSISKAAIIEMPGGESFIKNFSIKAGAPLMQRFTGIGTYNATRSHPLIEFDSDRFLIPIPFVLAEAIYESPFYWMNEDKNYRDVHSKNRGEAGEEIAFQFLSQVFGEKAYKRVLVKSGKSHTDTDIDILCILGSKALCVQAKSKRLTELSRKGSDEALKEDFQGAVQDAYEQAWIARQKILDKSSSFFDENRNQIHLSEGINEVYMLVLTTENYPSLTHQAHTLIELKEHSPNPLALTVFDLELVAHYLSDPYDFLYYIRQRVELINYFHAQEEMAFLGFHLTHKLWKAEKADNVGLDNDWAQSIDRNYFPLKAGLKVSDDGDSIKTRWKDERFDCLCNQIKTISLDKVTDIIFHLYDLSGSARSELIERIQETKKKTLIDGKFHSVAIPPDDDHERRFGLTYFSSETDSLQEVERRLFVLCDLRKYKCRAHAWLGLGSIKSSLAPFDLLIYNNNPWSYDDFMEENTKHLPDPVRLVHTSSSPKVGRNEPCPCGSGKKFKKCCYSKI